MNSLMTFLIILMMNSVTEDTNLTLRFGFHNMLSNCYDYQDVFEQCISHHLPVQVVELEWREDRYPGIYYWGRSDSIVIAAYQASQGMPMSIELHCRFDPELCSPSWAPVWNGCRMIDFDNYDRMALYLGLLVDRYKPGGVLAQELGWSLDWGIRHYDIFGEADRMWCSESDPSLPPYDLDPSQMNIDGLAALYTQLRSSIQSHQPDAEVPFSTLSIPFAENNASSWGWYPPLDDENEYCEFVLQFLSSLESMGEEPPDAFDWHIFPGYIDPLNPGLWEPDSSYNWASKSLHDRSALIQSLIVGIECPVRSMEGCATPYWSEIPATLRTERVHISFQLSTIVEAAYNGVTDIIVFDSTIDDEVSADPGYMNQYEEWWNSSEDPADSLLDAYSRQAELLSGTYCADRVELSDISGDTLIYHQFHNPVTGLDVFQFRAKDISLPTTSQFTIPVGTDQVEFYHMLDSPQTVDCPNGFFLVPAGQSSDICWIREIEDDSRSVRTTHQNRVDLFVSSNPARGSAILSIRGNTIGSVTIDIFDLAGRVITSQVVDLQMGEIQSVEMDMSRFASGLYFVCIDETGSKPISFVLLD